MKLDPAIAEIRKVRHEISNDFDHDTKAILDHYKEMEANYQDRLISKIPRSPKVPDEQQINT